MKNFGLKILQRILKKLAQMTIRRYRPTVVGVTGSVGKTSTKLAIAQVLGSERQARYSRGSLNNQFGLPLTILGEWSHKELKLVSKLEPAGIKRISKAMFWLKVVLLGALRWASGRVKYPEVLILEYGVDRPGDMKYLLEIAKPNIGVITAIGDIPVHVEFFDGPLALAQEKVRLIESLPPGGFAVLNHDDNTVARFKGRTRARVITFGFGPGADIRIAEFKNRVEGNARGREKRLAGISFKLACAGGDIPIKLDGLFGKAQAYAGAAAAAIGLLFEMQPNKITEALKTYHGAPGRMELVPGVKHTYLIDDSYNASPLSMHAALHTLGDLPGKRKIAVLGDMLELGAYTIEAHEIIGRLAVRIADILVTVGSRAKFIAEAAKKAGMPKRSVYVFDEPEEAGRGVQDLMRRGDLVLIKASRAMHLEKVVEELRAF